MSKSVKSITKVDYAVAGSVVVGIAAFGLLMYGIRKLPTNQVTAPVKNVAEIAAAG